MIIDYIERDPQHRRMGDRKRRQDSTPKLVVEPTRKTKQTYKTITHSDVFPCLFVPNKGVESPEEDTPLGDVHTKRDAFYL